MFEGVDELLDFVKLSRLTVSTANRVTTAQITGAGDAGDDSTAETVDACEVVQPLGLMANPTLAATTEALIARLGDRPVVLAIMDKGRAAQAVEAGGVKLYGPGSANAAAVLYIRASGAIELTTVTNTDATLTAGGTGRIVMQDGSQAFVRGNQFSTATGTFTTAITALLSAMTAYVTAIQAIADPANASTPAMLTAITTASVASSAYGSATASSLSTKIAGQ